MWAYPQLLGDRMSITAGQSFTFWRTECQIVATPEICLFILLYRFMPPEDAIFTIQVQPPRNGDISKLIGTSTYLVRVPFHNTSSCPGYLVILIKTSRFIAESLPDAIYLPKCHRIRSGQGVTHRVNSPIGEWFCLIIVVCLVWPRVFLTRFPCAFWVRVTFLAWMCTFASSLLCGRIALEA